jgi:hypothetical protein
MTIPLRHSRSFVSSQTDRHHVNQFYGGSEPTSRLPTGLKARKPMT